MLYPQVFPHYTQQEFIYYNNTIFNVFARCQNNPMPGFGDRQCRGGLPGYKEYGACGIAVGGPSASGCRKNCVNCGKFRGYMGKSPFF
jgi:hypothetical protein